MFHFHHAISRIEKLINLIFGINNMANETRIRCPSPCNHESGRAMMIVKKRDYYTDKGSYSCIYGPCAVIEQLNLLEKTVKELRDSEIPRSHSLWEGAV
jgi:hypothetical protein